MDNNNAIKKLFESNNMFDLQSAIIDACLEGKPININGNEHIIKKYHCMAINKEDGIYAINIYFNPVKDGYEIYGSNKISKNIEQELSVLLYPYARLSLSEGGMQDDRYSNFDFVWMLQ